MAVKVRGGVMSTEGSTKAAATFEIDMRDLLQAKKDRASGVRQEPAGDYSSLVSQISGQSVHEIDHLIEGVQLDHLPRACGRRAGGENSHA